MLSEKEKKEMIDDAKNIERREHFRAAGTRGKESRSLDDYLTFLDNMQKIFRPFKISRQISVTKFNKL